MEKRNWKAKYMTLAMWDSFRANDWKHLNWKVDTTIALLLIVLAVALAKLFD